MESPVVHNVDVLAHPWRDEWDQAQKDGKEEERTSPTNVCTVGCAQWVPHEEILQDTWGASQVPGPEQA